MRLHTGTEYIISSFVPSSKEIVRFREREKLSNETWILYSVVLMFPEYIFFFFLGSFCDPYTFFWIFANKDELNGNGYRYTGLKWGLLHVTNLYNVSECVCVSALGGNNGWTLYIQEFGIYYLMLGTSFFMQTTFYFLWNYIKTSPSFILAWCMFDMCTYSRVLDFCFILFLFLFLFYSYV